VCVCVCVCVCVDWLYLTQYELVVNMVFLFVLGEFHDDLSNYYLCKQNCILWHYSSSET
jgi:hypothetical protein